MYTRFYKFSVKPDKKEEFLDVHQLISDIVLDSMGGRIQYLRDINDDTQWTVMEQMDSKDVYEQNKDQVEAELGRTDLKERLKELLINSEAEPETSEYYMFMEVSAADEY